MLYALVLLIHSWLRWVVLVTGAASVTRAALGVTGQRPWTRVDRTLGVAFLAGLDTQVVLGLLLYFWLSPVTPKSLADFRATMPVAPLRFFAIEHVFGMLLGVAAAHAGWRMLKKSVTNRSRHMCVAVAFGIALVALAVAIPWPWMPYGRPLFRTL
jgi:hypothetical protein